MLYLLEEVQGQIWGKLRVNLYNNKYFETVLETNAHFQIITKICTCI